MTEIVDDKSEITRKLNEWAIAAGRLGLSTQTGYFHYYYGLPQSGHHQTIPLYENALFALALLRSRQIENIKEAQQILMRLLTFQNKESTASAGNFPVYLHEYPFCRDFSLGTQLLAPFYWILLGFRHVLGSELRTNFEKCVENLIQYGLNADESRPFPYSVAARFAAGLVAFGHLFERNEWLKIGFERLEQLGKTPALDSWYHTAHLADLFIAAQMAPAEFNSVHWKPFWNFVEQTWHVQLACYCGPSLCEKQEQAEPELNLYDLYMGYFTGRLAGRAHRLKFVHLQAALIHPSTLTVHPVLTESVEGIVNHEKWSCVKQPTWACTLLDKRVPVSEKREKTYTPFRLLWDKGYKADKSEVTHSFVCQGGQASSIECTQKENRVEMIFELEGPFDGYLEKAREICYYFDMYPDLTITVEGQRTNTFELGQAVKVDLGNDKVIQIVFELIEGEGQFLGHLSQANRPSQIGHMEDKKPQIFDWILFLRTLRRSQKCKVKVSIILDL